MEGTVLIRFAFLRPLMLAALVGAVALTTWLRTPIDTDQKGAQITFAALSEREGLRGQLSVRGIWEMSAPHPFFGGFSALVSTGDGRLLAGSDRGWTLAFRMTDQGPHASGNDFVYFAERQSTMQDMFDLEAITRDPATGTLWSTYEGFNAVQRDSPAGSRVQRIPPEMRDWSANSGPETIEILADGSFLILSEAPDDNGGRDRPGLLFAGDPITDTDPVTFRVLTPRKFSPVDAAALPDGRVLILLRRVRTSIPAAFDAAIMLADPATITQGGDWTGEVIANLDGPILGENFEGIAFVPDEADADPVGRGSVYLIADDNFSVFQRNLLVQLDWPPAH